MRCYFDSAYVAKCYLNERDSSDVRTLARDATGLYSSAWCIAELACTFQRHIGEGKLRKEQAAEQRALFLDDIRNGVWAILPVSDRLLYGVESAVSGLPSKLYLRAGDAVHIVTARAAGFNEIWTSDRRLLAAAEHFGLAGRSV